MGSARESSRPDLRETRVAVLSSCNLDLLRGPLVTALQRRGLNPDLWVAGFNQYRQELLDPASTLYAFQPEATLLFLEAADLFADLYRDPFSQSEEIRRDGVRRSVEDLGNMVGKFCERLPGATLYLNTISLDGLNCAYGLEFNSAISLRRINEEYNGALEKLARETPQAVVVDVASLAAATGLDHWHDPRLWYVGRIRLSSKAHMQLGYAYANSIAARLGKVRKCLVLDLDNTLWGGIIGEDGLAGIQLGSEGIGLAFAEFQQELLNLYRKGVLLAICSRNNEADVLEVLRSHPAMVLREEFFSSLRIDWSDKAESLRNIARDLNIGFESMVFIDDSPAERERVRQELPEVLTPDWPADPGEYKRELLRLARQEFLKFDLTEEDSRRGEMYKAQTVRGNLTASGKSLPDYYRSLQMTITIGTADDLTLPRIAQLTQKTNQFNLTTRRYTEPEILELSQSDGVRVYWIDLKDRFGPNGIIGVIIARETNGKEWSLDTFLLSCRVINRSVEQAFLALVTEDLATLGATAVIGEYRPSPKNGMVADLYRTMRFEQYGNAPGRCWKLNLTDSRVEMPSWFEVQSKLATASLEAREKLTVHAARKTNFETRHDQKLQSN